MLNSTVDNDKEITIGLHDFQTEVSEDEDKEKTIVNFMDILDKKDFMRRFQST